MSDHATLEEFEQFLANEHPSTILKEFVLPALDQVIEDFDDSAQLNQGTDVGKADQRRADKLTAIKREIEEL